MVSRVLGGVGISGSTSFIGFVEGLRFQVRRVQKVYVTLLTRDRSL